MSVSPLLSPSVGLLMPRHLLVPLPLLGPARRGNPASLLSHLGFFLPPQVPLLLPPVRSLLMCLGLLPKLFSQFMPLKFLLALADSPPPYVLLAWLTPAASTTECPNFLPVPWCAWTSRGKLMYSFCML